jgi:hypothetical protein
VFYAARFFAFFIAPGLLLGAGAAALQPSKDPTHFR